MRIACSSWSFLDMCGKEAFLNHLETACKTTSKPKIQLKEATRYSICVTFLVLLRIESCYPGVLQDVIAENQCVKEIMSKIAF